MAVSVLRVLQVEERGKLVCQPEGFYPSLTAEDVTVSTPQIKSIGDVRCCVPKLTIFLAHRTSVRRSTKSTGSG